MADITGDAGCQENLLKLHQSAVLDAALIAGELEKNAAGREAVCELSVMRVDCRFDEIRHTCGKQSRSCAEQKLSQIGMSLVISAHDEVRDPSSQATVDRMF